MNDMGSGRAPGLWLMDFYIVALAFGLAGGAILWLYSHGIALCLFHAISGLPCPFCGGTRAVAALFRGELVQALAYNSLMCLGAFLAPVHLLRRPSGMVRRGCSSRWWRMALVAAVAANWVYLICVGR